MKIALFFLFTLLLLLSVSDVRSGTLVPPGHGGTVCQGSTCTPSDGGSGGGVVGGAGGNATAGAVATSVATAGAIAAQRQSVRQTNLQRQSTTVTVGGASQTVTVNGGYGSGGGSVKYEEKVDMALAVPPATAPCRVAVGAGFASSFGISLGGSVLDEGCDTREDVRTLWAVGLQGAAYNRLCQKPEMAAAMGETLCPQQPKAEPTVTSGFVH